MTGRNRSDYLIIVRGAGDIATGTISRLHLAGFPVLVLETDSPSAIRRQVALSEAVYDGMTTVENVTAERIETLAQMEEVWNRGRIPLLVDPKGESIRLLKPAVVVDAILAKKNLGTRRDMAPLTIALGPGFCAGEDVDYVIETMRGHNLGRIICSGGAQPNTGIPGVIAGYAAERVIHAESAGILKNVRAVGDIVTQGEIIAEIVPEQNISDKQNISDTADRHCEQCNTRVYASIDGLLRGLIRDGYYVTKGFKIADIDPRKDQLKNTFTISDKARCIAGSVLELVCAELL